MHPCQNVHLPERKRSRNSLTKQSGIKTEKIEVLAHTPLSQLEKSYNGINILLRLKN